MKVKKTIMVLMLATVVILTAACGNSSGADSGELNPDMDNMQKRTDLLGQYRFDDNVNQLLFVSHTTGWDAKAFFYEKSETNDAWILTGEYDAYIGKNGMGKTGEGDGKTPDGDYEVVSGFGILPDPGTGLPYLDIKPSTFACDEECEFYNQIIDAEETGHKCNGEEMYTYSPQYNYGITVGYNKENKYPDGSAIFLHCKGQKAYTGGCVAFDQADMETILKHSEPGMHVYFDEYYEVK